MARRWIPVILGLLVVTLVVVGPLAYSKQRQQRLRNFRVVEEGKLYRSGQLTLTGLKQVIHDHNIRTVISLRYAEAEGQRPPDWKEEEYCRSVGIRYYRIRPREWKGEDERQAPAQQGVDQLLKIMDDPSNYPVLLHCYAGMHRTGAHCAIYRMEYQRWSNEEAMSELRALGYKNLDSEPDVHGYLQSYVPRWKRMPAPAE